MVFCHNCGKNCPSGNFCSGCGTKLQKPTTTTTSPTTRNFSVTKKTTPTRNFSVAKKTTPTRNFSKPTTTTSPTTRNFSKPTTTTSPRNFSVAKKTTPTRNFSKPTTTTSPTTRNFSKPTSTTSTKPTIKKPVTRFNSSFNSKSPAQSSPNIASKTSNLSVQVDKKARRKSKNIDIPSDQLTEKMKGLDVAGITVTKTQPKPVKTQVVKIPQKKTSTTATYGSSKPAMTVSRSKPVISRSKPSAASKTTTSTTTTTSSSSSPKTPSSISNRWAQMMQQKKEQEHAAERAKIRGRRRGGVEFMDKQIRKLISELKSTGGKTKYGDLFKKTVETMPALAATLATAKKRGVVQFEGTMLMQGVHNHVEITLLKDEIEDSSVFISKYGMAPVNAGGSFEKPKDCFICQKKVLPMERVSANGKTLHKQCFRCCECKCTLKLAAFSFNSGKFYCNVHFKRNFQKNTSYNF